MQIETKICVNRSKYQGFSSVSSIYSPDCEFDLQKYVRLTVNNSPFNCPILVNGDRRNGVTTIKFRRPLQTNDVHDKSVPTDRNVSIIAAIGPLNSRREANAHAKDGRAFNVNDLQIHFSSQVSAGQ